jgi:hypothetical protein
MIKLNKKIIILIFSVLMLFSCNEVNNEKIVENEKVVEIFEIKEENIKTSILL